MIPRLMSVSMDNMNQYLSKYILTRISLIPQMIL